jgi:hypothetical protein
MVDDEGLLSELRSASSTSRANPLAALRFEAVIQAVANIVRPPADFLKCIRVLGLPNSTHSFLAREIGRGATVLTVNFDDRIEVACEEFGVDPRRFVVTPANRRPLPGAGLVKLHGTFVRRGRSAPWATLGKIGEAGLR